MGCSPHYFSFQEVIRFLAVIKKPNDEAESSNNFSLSNSQVMAEKLQATPKALGVATSESRLMWTMPPKPSANSGSVRMPDVMV
jgi:hypothetical protein